MSNQQNSSICTLIISKDSIIAHINNEMWKEEYIEREMA